MGVQHHTQKARFRVAMQNKTALVSSKRKSGMPWGKRPRPPAANAKFPRPATGMQSLCKSVLQKASAAPPRE